MLPKGVHYRHVLTSKVADCTRPRQRWDIFKRRKNQYESHHNRTGQTNPAHAKAAERMALKQLSKTLLPAGVTDTPSPPRYSAP